MNQTMLDLWYTKNGGSCTIWLHEHLFIIKPGDTIVMFSDLVCEKQYCEKNPTYARYLLIDIDRNCNVRVLPECRLSDMSENINEGP